jgi:hypothetical protein
MKKISLLFLLVLGISVSAKAEFLWKAGFVVLNSGDTLRGEIKVNAKKELPMFSKISFKMGETTKMYKPEQITSYGYDDKRFLSRKLEGEMTFLKVLSYGRVIFYELQYEMQRGADLIVDSEYYMEKNDGSGAAPTKVKSNKFKKMVADVMADHTELVEKVQSEDKKYEYNDMVRIVEEYNNWYEEQNGQQSQR